MNKKQMLEAVESYLQPILDEFKFALVDTEYVKEGPNYFLRIYIDKDGGVNIDDCRATSRAIEAVLDEKELIKDAYTLEVSSPGLDRILKKDREFEYFKGRLVDVKLYKAVDGEKHMMATLDHKDGDKLYLSNEGEEIVLDMKDIAVVRLAVIF